MLHITKVQIDTKQGNKQIYKQIQPAECQIAAGLLNFQLKRTGPSLWYYVARGNVRKCHPICPYGARFLRPNTNLRPAPSAKAASLNLGLNCHETSRRSATQEKIRNDWSPQPMTDVSAELMAPFAPWMQTYVRRAPRPDSRTREHTHSHVTRLYK